MREDLKSMKIYRAPAADVLNLGNNENFYSEWNTKLADDISEVVKNTNFLHYGPEIHQALLKSYAEYIGVDSKNVLVGPGSEQLIPLLFNALTDEKVLAPNPDFFRYAEIAKVAKRQIFQVAFDEHVVDNMIETANREEVELIILSTPNNPEGLVYSREELIRLLDNVSSYVVVDEAYAEFSGKSIVDLLDKYPKLIIMRTLSKAFGIAGLRVGFVLAQEEIINFLLAIQGPFVVSALNAGIANLVLQHVPEVLEQIEAIKAGRDDLYEFLKGFPELEVYPSSANFVYFKSPKNAAIRQKLLDNKIAVSFFAPDAIRLTVGKTEHMDKFKKLFCKIIKEL